MADRSSKPRRPRDPNVRGKLIVDIATGQVEDVIKEPKRQYSPRVHEPGQTDKPEDKKTRQDWEFFPRAALVTNSIISSIFELA